MALTHLLVLVGAALSLTFFSRSEAGEVGVCYGMQASNMMKPPAVVQLLQRNSITMVRLYDADPAALSALANTGIKVSVSLPNPNLKDAATSMSYALQWVQTNVKAYPNTLIDSVVVGNEVFHQVYELTPQLLPAMKNIWTALSSVGLADTVKVSTPIALDALKVPSFPPSLGEFKDDIAQLVMSPMIDFLDQTGSHLMFNIYPYFAYKYNPNIDLNFVLFRDNNGQLDPGTGLMYYNLFDAMLDAVYHAVEKLGNSHKHTQGRMLSKRKLKIKVSESGLSSKGSIGPFLKHNTSDLGWCISCQDSAEAASKENAQTYNSNLIKKVISGIGTPYYPDADISVYVFSLFNENMKTGDEDERNFGLFYPNDGTPVYNVDFVHPGPAPSPATASWCMANAAVGDKRLQAALDYACSHGADCSAIQPGKPCYQPNSVVAHASYAFNDYYQRNDRASGACDFAGAAFIVYQKPAGICDANSGSWCVAKATTGDTRLQAALDYACGYGADCTAIQPGGRCFDPNTKVAHASYAFNDYYQRNGRSDQSCDFGGAGSVVHQQPRIGNCVLETAGKINKVQAFMQLGQE